MSRIGKKPIVLPKEVKVTYDNGTLTVKGPKGTLTRTLHQSVDLEVTSAEVKVIPKEDIQANWRYWGLERTLVANMVTGVSTGFTKTLDIIGTGYKVEDKGSHLLFNLGFSHPIEFKLPPGYHRAGGKSQSFNSARGQQGILGPNCRNYSTDAATGTI